MAEFNVTGGGAKLRSDLNIKPEDMFVSIQEKVNNETADQIFDMYKQNEGVLSGLLGLGKIFSGGTMDPPAYTHGSHSFGIRDLGLEEWPTAQYGLDKDNFKLNAEVGPEGEGWRAGVQGTYTFADGGIIGNSDMGIPWNPNFQVRDAAWIEGRDWYRGPSGEEIPISRWRRPRDQPIHPEKIKHLERINREYKPIPPSFVPFPGSDVIPGFGARARPLPGPDIWSEEYISGSPGMPEAGGALPGGGGFDERAGAIAISDNRIPQKNTGIRANTRSPAPIARTPQQPMRHGPTSSNPRNPYVSSIANHPLVNPPTIPTMGGGLSSLDRVGWGAF